MPLNQSTVETEVNAPVEEAFRFIVPISLPAIFTGYGVLPAVVKTEDQTGDWNAAGQTRRVILSDGSSAREKLDSYESPSRFSYTVDSFTGPLSFLVKSANGEWQFEQRLNVTHIKWTYRFNPRFIFTTPIVWIIAQLLWRGYMGKALRLSKDQLETTYEFS